jgi:hypothetical protein
MSTRAFAVVVVVMVCARASADSVTKPAAPGDAPVFDTRLTDLKAWVHGYAQRREGSLPFKDPTQFCTPFSDWDMQGKASALWGELAKTDRYDLLPQLAGLVELCRYSPGAAKRAGFVIDYLYWNRLADTTGYEVADALMIRDVFREIYINQLAQDAIAKNRDARATPPANPPNDFLTARPMSNVGLAKKASAVVNAFSSAERASFDAMADLVNFREGYLTPFGNDLLQILRTPDDLRVLREFYSYLQDVQQHPRLLGELHGGWHKLMQITGNKAEQATRVFGVMASLLYLPLEDLAPALAARGQLQNEYIDALHDGSMAYYLINELDERSAKTSADDDHSLSYHFFYPDSYSSNDWKWYHWYNNAHLGCRVARRGFTKQAVANAADLLGKFYEAVTMNMVIPSRDTIGLDPRVNPILESYEDVRINRDGAAFGAEVCKK